MYDGLDYYAVLGVPRGASAADIRRAFRALAKALHPDSQAPDRHVGALDFQIVTEAYETLRDEARRRTYDAELDATRQIAPAASSKPFKRAFAIGLAAGLAVAFAAVAGLKYADRHWNRPVKSQESLSSKMQNQGESIGPQAERNSTSIVSKGRDSSGGQASEPDAESIQSMEPPASEAAPQSAPVDSQQIPSQMSSNASQPEAASRDEQTEEAAEPLPSSKASQPQPGSFAASVAALEDPARSGGARIAAYRLLTLINSAVSTADLEQAAASAKDPQTRKLIGDRLAALRLDKENSARKTGDRPRHEPDDGVTVATGTPANEKLSVLKPGRGRAEAFADCRDCPEMVVVPAGQAVLGGHEQGAWNFRGEPGSARTVVLKTPFAVSRYPISIERWRACVEAGACRPAPFLIAIRPALPATRVSWFDAQGYVQWLSQVTGRRYRLLSEAEWEYLRLGQAGERPGLLGETPFQRYSPLFGLGLKRITDTPANAWGIHPMPEGVLEWVEDCWHPSLNQAPTDGSAWLSSGRGDCSYRVVRGAGSIGLGGFRRQQLARAMEFADVRTIEIGFRVARDIAGPTVTALEAK